MFFAVRRWNDAYKNKLVLAIDFGYFHEPYSLAQFPFK